MAFKITQRSAADVPTPGRTGKVNEDLVTLKDQMKRLGPGMVLEIEPQSGQSVRATKGLVSRAAKDLGASWRHWSEDGKVFAKPAVETRRRGRPRKAP